MENRKPLLVIRNRHILPKGADIPQIDQDNVEYLAYFENDLREQMVFVVPHGRAPLLYCGDWGWLEPANLRSHHGVVVAVRPDSEALQLRPVEEAWLRACVLSSRAELPHWNPEPHHDALWSLTRARAIPPSSRQLPAIRVFFSSPAQLRPERLVGVEVCRALAKELGLPIEPILWEGGGQTHPDVPSIPPSATKASAQAVIDDVVWRAMGGYDIYIGMVWHHCGTETAGYRSGTEAELKFALAQHKAEKRPSSILFYRKTAPVRPDELRLDQLQAAFEFIGEVRKFALVKDFDDVDELRQTLLLDLREAVNEILHVEPFWARLLSAQRHD